MEDANVMAEAIALETLMADIKLPPMPTAGASLLEMTQKPIDSINIKSLAKLVETDPGILTKVLQLANSSFYGTANNIVNLRQAIVHIGLEETVSSVYMFFFRNTMPKFPSIKELTGEDYWAHSWACAQANKMLGHPDFNVNALPGELYIAGLLQGVGKLILAMYRPENFAECVRIASDKKIPLTHAELEVFGTTDSLVASKFMKTWHIPDNICAAIGACHTPGIAAPEHRELAALTQFAYYLANISGIGNSGDATCCNDLSETWLAQQKGTTPFAEESTRERALKEIVPALQKKAANLKGGNPNATKETDRGHDRQESAKPRPRASQKRPAAKKSAPPKKQGIMGWLRDLFGA